MCISHSGTIMVVLLLLFVVAVAAAATLMCVIVMRFYLLVSFKQHFKETKTHTLYAPLIASRLNKHGTNLFLFVGSFSFTQSNSSFDSLTPCITSHPINGPQANANLNK